MGAAKPDHRAELHELGAALLESDAVYFEAAARLEVLPGAVLAWMEGLASLPAAGVVQRIAPNLGGLAPAEWLNLVEDAVRRAGRVATRLYLIAPHPELEPVLRRRGYRARAEIGFVAFPKPDVRRGSPRRVSLRAIELERDWAIKHALHSLSDTSPDGHPARADDWVALERRKVEAGYMRPYLLQAGSEVCGTLSLARRDGLIRIKNLLLHPTWRRRGIGTELVEVLVELAGQTGGGARAVGVLALEQSPGESLYRKCGLVPVARQIEWIRMS